MMLPPELPKTPFTWPDARRLGILRARFDELIANRVIRKVLQNVYVRSEVPDTTEVRARAAVLVLSPFAVACDRTAAWIMGVDTFDYRELDILPALETFVLRGQARTRRPECRGGERDLLDRDVCLISGVPVTTPLRTALDLGCKLPRRDALAAMDAFMRQYGLSREELQVEARRYFRRRGVVQLRQLIPLADPRSESSGESWTRLGIIDAGLPVPEPQCWVEDRGVPLFRLDLGYPRARVCVEYDGRQFHERLHDREHDEERRAWLKRHGWIVIVVTKDSFTDEAMGHWLEELRVALRLAV